MLPLRMPFSPGTMAVPEGRSITGQDSQTRSTREGSAAWGHPQQPGYMWVPASSEAMS